MSRVRLFATPWTVAHQAPLSTQFPRQECWSGLPSPGDLPNPGIEPGSPALQADSLLSHQGSPTPTFKGSVLEVIRHFSWFPIGQNLVVWRFLAVEMKSGSLKSWICVASAQKKSSHVDHMASQRSCEREVGVAVCAGGAWGRSWTFAKWVEHWFSNHHFEILYASNLKIPRRI